MWSFLTKCSCSSIILIWVSCGLNVKLKTLSPRVTHRRIKNELHRTRTKHWCTNNETTPLKKTFQLTEADDTSEIKGVSCRTTVKSSLLPYRPVVIIRSSKDSCRRKVSGIGVTWDIITNGFYSNFEITCRVWVSRALWSRTSPSLLVSVHEHILSVKHQIHGFTNTTYKPSSGISFFQNDACDYIKLTCSGTCHVLRPTRQHWQGLSLAASRTDSSNTKRD